LIFRLPLLFSRHFDDISFRHDLLLAITPLRHYFQTGAAISLIFILFAHVVIFAADYHAAADYSHV